MRAYVCGPMSGLPSMNYPAFEAARHALLNEGYSQVGIPCDLDTDSQYRAAVQAADDVDDLTIETGVTWAQYLSRSIRHLLDGDYDRVHLLKNWQESRGAKIEAYAAFVCGIPVCEFEHRDRRGDHLTFL